jgi:hypothetical protein
MNPRVAPCVLAATIMLGSSVALSGEGGRGSLLIENDMWGGLPSDQNYTMGVGLVFSEVGLPDSKLLRAFQDGLGAVNRLTRINTSPAGSVSETLWTIGSTNFTPAVITMAKPIRNDRPFASLLYLGVGYTDTSEKRAIETELQIGVLGTGIGRSVQTWIHEQCCRDRIPMGWDNQIGNGGSPTFLYHARWLNQVAGDENTRVYTAVGGEVGYYVRGTAGLIFLYGATAADLAVIRLGGAALGLRTLRSEAQVMNEANPPPGQSRSEAPATHGSGFGLWLEYEASAMFYNELLQGAWSGTNQVKFSSSQIQHFVQRASLGVDLTFIPKKLGLLRDSDSHIYFTQGWRSQDIKTVLPKNHYWGGLTFSWACK